MILHVRCSGLEGAVIKTCAKLYQFFPRGRVSTPQAHIDFYDVRTPSEFSVIEIPTRPTPVAAPRGRNETSPRFSNKRMKLTKRRKNDLYTFFARLIVRGYHS